MGLAAAFLMASAQAANAQDSLDAFGSYPAGITTGSQYGFYPGGYRPNPSTYRARSGYVVAPRPTYYSSGFYGGTPGATTYSPGINYSSPNAAAYGYAAPLYGTTTYPSTYGTTYARPVRRGLFGRRTYYYSR
jgi:hypothetical protein